MPPLPPSLASFVDGLVDQLIRVRYRLSPGGLRHQVGDLRYQLSRARLPLEDLRDRPRLVMLLVLVPVVLVAAGAYLLTGKDASAPPLAAPAKPCTSSPSTASTPTGSPAPSATPSPASTPTGSASATAAPSAAPVRVAEPDLDSTATPSPTATPSAGATTAACTPSPAPSATATPGEVEDTKGLPAAKTTKLEEVGAKTVAPPVVECTQSEGEVNEFINGHTRYWRLDQAHLDQLAGLLGKVASTCQSDQTATFLTATVDPYKAKRPEIPAAAGPHGTAHCHKVGTPASFCHDHPHENGHHKSGAYPA